MKVNEKDARDIVEAYGLNSNGKSVRWLEAKLNDLPALAGGRERPEDKTLAELMDEVVRQVEDGEDIKVTSDSEEEGPPLKDKRERSSKGGRSKGNPEEPAQPSSKSRIYQLWKKKPKTTSEEAMALVGDSVKESTVKGWLSAWKRGQNLPAVAKK